MLCSRWSQLYVSHMCKRIFRFKLQAVTDKISNFHEIVPNSTYSHKLQFFKYICNFLDQLLHPYKFHGRDMSGILFFIFASCELLNHPLCTGTFEFINITERDNFSTQHNKIPQQRLISTPETLSYQHNFPWNIFNSTGQIKYLCTSLLLYTFHVWRSE